MIKITVSNKKAFATGPFPPAFIKLSTALSGRKLWDGDNAVKFEASGGNIRTLRESGLDIDWHDDDGELAKQDALANLDKLGGTEPLNYTPKVPLFKHQQTALNVSWEREAYALLLEMGLGKTAIALHTAGALYRDDKLTGVLILAPKGVHRQWIEQQLPEHLDNSIETNLAVWPNISIIDATKLTFFAMNIDAIRTEKGFNVAKNFLKHHNGKSMLIIDESHNIKSPSAQRTKASWKLGQLATFRRILTGTPISKTIMDAWSQFKFLDTNILGQPYAIGFRNRYCIMGGFENKQIVGSKNVEEFYELIAPHAFRLTKEEALDLPPKHYVVREYEMGDAVFKHYDDMKHTFMAELKDGTIVDAAHAAVALIRLQQILSGYLPKEKEFEAFSDERIEVLLDIVSQINGSVVVWARFIEDIKRIEAALSKIDECVVYYGGVQAKERGEAVEKFKNGEVRFFIANAQTGGQGIDGLQSVCHHAIYYNNDFNALNRWQSEDRIHRMGMGDQPAMYFDIVAQKSVDKLVLRNLKGKKSLADLTLDEIRQGLSDG